MIFGVLRPRRTAFSTAKVSRPPRLRPLARRLRRVHVRRGRRRRRAARDQRVPAAALRVRRARPHNGRGPRIAAERVQPHPDRHRRRAGIAGTRAAHARDTPTITRCPPSGTHLIATAVRAPPSAPPPPLPPPFGHACMGEDGHARRRAHLRSTTPPHHHS
eukprot:3854310-Pleurochrysis_carterae.AAC.2